MTRTKQAEGKPMRESVSKPLSESKQEAVRVRAFLDGGPAPDFLRYVIVDAIREASRRTGAPEPEVHHTRGYDLEALAYLFEAASRIDSKQGGEVMQRADNAKECPDVLQRMQDALSVPFDYKPITHEQAAELADRITHYEDDEVVYALIKLLHGICEAKFHNKDVEGLVLYAVHRAYSKTVHFSDAYQEFAQLDPNSERDSRVLQRRFVD